VTEAAFVLGAALAVLCVLYVARPFLRDPEPADDRLEELDDLDRRRAELEEERDRALAALKELELDHRTGAVSDGDYRALVGPLRRRAAEALRALEPRAAGLRRARDGQAGAMTLPPGEATPPTPSPVPEPYPPPDEGTPPTPAPVPEPGPPPDEGTPPTPPPDEGAPPRQI
jgi:hypothetical protein